MSDLASVQVTVHGRVQGVFFRAFASSRGKELGLTGYVRNLATGNAVEVVAEGERNQLEELIGHLAVGPPGAIVEKITTRWTEYTAIHVSFSARY